MHGVRTVLPDLSIRQLEYLVAVADSPSWAAAAERVGVSPSALSQGLAELERRVGVPLFDREGRRRVLRPGAAPVLDHARQVVALTGDLARWAQRSASGELGQLRVGMIDVAAVDHFPEVLARFRREQPDVDLHLRVAPSGALLDELRAGGLDVVVCVDPGGEHAGLDITPVMVEELAVYAPDGRRPTRPGTWGPWVLFPETSSTRGIVVDALTALGAPIEVVAESHQPEVLREMVRLGLGWTVLPVTQAESGDRPLAAGRRVAERTLVAAHRVGSVADPVAAVLIEMLRGQVGKGTGTH